MNSTIRRFALSELPATPWKNGGGITREIACWPPGAGLDAFGWRISVADIAASGPFSAFPGVDRIITLLEGDGVRLRGGAIEHRLAEPFAPFAFPGDAPLDCDLLGGASRDFNVMVRRADYLAEVLVLHGAQPLQAAPYGMLLALRGSWSISSDGGPVWTCPPETGVWWADVEHAASLRPDTPGAVLLAARIMPRD